MAVKSVSIRIEEEMLNKLAYVSEFAGRSVNSEILVLIREEIERHEEKYGKINIANPVNPEQNVRPPKKRPPT